MKSLYSKLYLILLAAVPLTPRFGATDNVITHYFSLGLVAIYGLVLILISNKEFKSFKFNYFNLPGLSFLGFFLIALLSYFFAINRVESLIALSKIFIFLIHIYIFYKLKLYEVLSEKLILFSISSLLLIESIVSIYPVIEIVSVTSYKLEFANDFLKGLAGNKNITAASLVMKIPFVLLVYHQYKSRLVKFISLFILTIVIINLLFLGSRASFISLFLIFITYVLFILFKNRNELNLSFLLKHLHIPVILILSFLFFNSNVAQDDQGTIQNRVSSFVVEDLDESSLQRIRFYKQALKFSLENPLMGAGIGNWKVISVKLDKDYITSYIVPYVLHNDFLEVLGETNIIGLFFYVLFFISIFYIIKKNYFYNNNKSSDYKYVLVLLSLIAYLVDASLNFPLYRALMQISLLLTLLYVLKLHSMNKISKK